MPTPVVLRKRTLSQYQRQAALGARNIQDWRSATPNTACPKQSRPHANDREIDYMLRSKLRYWIASAICDDSIWSAPARAAMVRPTFSTRLYARALKPSLLIAVSSNFSA